MDLQHSEYFFGDPWHFKAEYLYDRARSFLIKSAILSYEIFTKWLSIFAMITLGKVDCLRFEHSLR